MSYVPGPFGGLRRVWRTTNVGYWLVGVDGDARRHKMYTRQRDAKKAARDLAREINGEVWVWNCTPKYGMSAKEKVICCMNGAPWQVFKGMQQKFLATPFTLQPVDAPFETGNLNCHWWRDPNGP